MIIKVNEPFERLDIFLIERLQKEKNISRSLLSKYIPSGVLVNGKAAKSSQRIKTGDILSVDMELLNTYVSSKLQSISQIFEIEAVNGYVKVIFEDKDLLVIDKQAGIAMHPGATQGGKQVYTLANYVKAYLMNKDEFDNEIVNAGIVHRLDKSVSGLTIWAKNSATQIELKNCFKEHNTLKIYEAEIQRIPSIRDGLVGYKENSWHLIEGYIKRDANNRLRRSFDLNEASFAKNASLYIMKKDDKVYIRLVTGRNHQIRATLRFLGYFVKGDFLYGNSSRAIKKSVKPEAISLKSILLGVNSRILGKSFWTISQMVFDKEIYGNFQS